MAKRKTFMLSEDDKVIIYRRRLPHWRMSHAAYFVTWRLHPRQPELTPAERDLLVSALIYFDGKRYHLYSYVIMNDHVHVLVAPFPNEYLHKLVHSWKSYTAKRMQHLFGRQGSIWQDEYFDRIMRDEAEFLEKAQYIMNNPIKRWPTVQDYQWQGFKQVEEEEADLAQIPL